MSWCFGWRETSGRVNQTKKRVHLSIEGEACAGEAQNAESNNGSIRLKINMESRNKKHYLCPLMTDSGKKCDRDIHS